MKEVYDPLYINDKPILSTSITTAEMIKYAANAFLALKISYINEVANLCETLGADVKDVAKAMGQDGRISPKFLHPGPGYGGSCFPKDTKAFAKLSKENGEVMHTIEASIQSNKNQKIRMVNKMKTLLGGSFKGKIISILGLAFKPNTDDVRESPALSIIPPLLEKEVHIRVLDPHGKKQGLELLKGVVWYDSAYDAAVGADLLVLLTEWNEFRALDIKLLSKKMRDPNLLDLRNVYSKEEVLNGGFKSYSAIGR